MTEGTALYLSIQMKVSLFPVLNCPGPRKVPGVLRVFVLVKWINLHR